MTLYIYINKHIGIQGIVLLNFYGRSGLALSQAQAADAWLPACGALQLEGGGLVLLTYVITCTSCRSIYPSISIHLFL